MELTICLITRQYKNTRFFALMLRKTCERAPADTNRFCKHMSLRCKQRSSTGCQHKMNSSGSCCKGFFWYYRLCALGSSLSCNACRLETAISCRGNKHWEYLRTHLRLGISYLTLAVREIELYHSSRSLRFKLYRYDETINFLNQLISPICHNSRIWLLQVDKSNQYNCTHSEQERAWLPLLR